MQSSISILPSEFVFSQSSLQDYVDCPRRFQLRYILRRVWPALESQPAMDSELYMQRGSQFHQMAHQFMLGISEEKIAQQVAHDEILLRWWENFVNTDQGGFGILSGPNNPEISLSTPIDNYRITAKFDLLVIDNKDDNFKATIYDWKTSRKRPKREWLNNRLQTRVYPYLLVKAGARFTSHEGSHISPEQVEMIYWFTDYPDEPARFPYNQEQYDQDEVYLASLIDEISNLGDEDAPLTEDERHCRFCKYRSLCNRGTEAGPLFEIDSDWDEQGFEFEVDFDEINEIEF